ncbi:MAG TPA: hypothetical protein VKA26_01730 [Ignavibacteriaceae bacterium]|nr:hypothetical protein [Ignavibacteriaceae bacterium]
MLYGMPSYSEDLEKELKTGTIALGGCMISDDSPFYKCYDCQKKFGKGKILKRRTKYVQY